MSRLVIFGATGMVGAGALLAALADPRVISVLVVSRSSTGRTHPRLRERLLADVFAVEALAGEFAACDACLFCLGVSSVGMREADYTRITYDGTLAVARAMAAANPHMTFCYVSGAGTDSSGPGFIQPLDGIRSKTGWYQALYAVSAPLYPLIHRLAPGVSTTTTNLGRALVEAALAGAPARVLESRAIHALAGAG